MLDKVLPVLQCILALGNIGIITYGVLKALGRPHDDLEKRVTVLEGKLNDIDHKLMQGNDKFRDYGKVLEVLLHCTLALVNFEVHYCETEHKDISDDLEESRKELNKCLSRINRDEE